MAPYLEAKGLMRWRKVGFAVDRLAALSLSSSSGGVRRQAKLERDVRQADSVEADISGLKRGQYKRSGRSAR